MDVALKEGKKIREAKAAGGKTADNRA